MAQKVGQGWEISPLHGMCGCGLAVPEKTHDRVKGETDAKGRFS